MADQGTTYAAYVADRLKVERERLDRIETRASGVITSSAAIIGLIVAALALIVGKDHTFTGFAAAAASFAVVAYALAMLFVLLAGMLRKSEVPDDATLQAALTEHWTDTEISARLACAWMDLGSLLTLRKANDGRTWYLDLALWAQLAGSVALVVATITEVWSLR